MTAYRCKYYRTSHGGPPTWEDGTLLQFVALSHGGVAGVVFCDKGGGLLHLTLKDIRMERTIPAENGLVAAPVS